MINLRTFLQKWRFGLTSRYLLHLIFVGITLSVLLVWTGSFQQRRTFFHEMEQRAILIGQSLSGACSLPYLYGDLSAVRQIFFQTKSVQDVESIALLDQKGQMEMQFGEFFNVDVFRVRMSQSTDLMLWSDSDHMFVMSPLLIPPQKTAGVIDGLVEPILAESPEWDNRLLGFVCVTLTLDRTRMMVRSFVLRSVAVTVAIVGLGCFFAFTFLRRNFLSPVQRLVDAMTAVRRGDLEMSLEEMGESYEVGTLTTTFNKMTRDLRQAEEELKQANAELERRVWERTQALERANWELQETQEKAVRSERMAAIGQLASGVGHELRNPLGAIRNAIYYIRDSMSEHKFAEKDPTLGEFLDLMDKEIRSATHIISDLLDFAQASKQTVQTTSLNQLLHEIRDVVDIPDNVKLIEKYEERLPKVSLDQILKECIRFLLIL